MYIDYSESLEFDKLCRLLRRIFKTWIHSTNMNVTIRHFFLSQNLFSIQYARYNEKKDLNKNMDFPFFKILLKGLTSFNLHFNAKYLFKFKVKFIY